MNILNKNCIMKKSFDILELIDRALVAGSADLESDTLKSAIEKGISAAKGEDWKIQEIYGLKRGTNNKLLVTMEVVPGRDEKTRKAEQTGKAEEVLQQLGTSSAEIKKSFKTDAEFWNEEYYPRFGEGYYAFMVGKTYKKLISMALSRRDFDPRLAKRIILRWQDWQEGVEPGDQGGQDLDNEI